MAEDQVSEKSSSKEVLRGTEKNELPSCSEKIHRTGSEPCLLRSAADDGNTKVHRINSSNDVFIEIPVPDCRNDRSLETLSDSDDSVVFCSDPEVMYQSNKIEKPKDLLTEISDILSSLSDDERFLECIHFSNKNSFVLDDTAKRRTSVDLIFTYNVLNILYNKLKELKAYFELTQTENSKLRKERHIADAEHVAYQIQVESLQKTVEGQKREIQAMRESILLGKEKHDAEIQSLSNKFENELKSFRKRYENADNEKNIAVMKYVTNESELINIRKERENLVKRVKGVENERDELSKKLKILMSEKNTISQTLEQKKHELVVAAKDIEKLRDELNCKDIKCKWVEENLRKELSQCQEQNSNLNIKICKYEDIIKKYKVDSCFDSDNFNSDEENIFANGVYENKINSDKVNDGEGKTATETATDEDDRTDDTKLLQMKIQKLKDEKADYDKNIVNLKETIESQNEKLTLLEEQVSEMENLRHELAEIQENLRSSRHTVEELSNLNDELKQEMESCREREAELLNFTEKLTNKNVNLQSEFAILEAKKLSLEADRVPLEEQIEELTNNVILLNKKLEKEAASYTAEIQRLTSINDELNEKIESLKALLEEQQAENQSLKLKYSSSIRELTKEVQQYRKLKQFEVPEGSSSSDSVCLESRTSSCNSLNDTQSSKVEPDRQALIERIVKLQKRNVKYMEKIEFLEEHVNQLLAEVKKKNRVIQHYVLREQSGALSSKNFDEHKAEVSKYGGIMASLYSSKSDDNALSLELSMEINRKLQAVLEDTILKNITLKENVETLGKEIARLTSVSKFNES